MRSGAEVFESSWRAAWSSEPELLVSEWADEHRILTNRAGNATVRWSTSAVEPMRAIMDSLSQRSPYKRTVLMKGNQIAGTESGNNWIGYIIHHTPGAVLMMRPSLDEARRFSRQRLDPMIETTAVLRARVAESRSREGGNSLLTKEFPGGILFLAGSNSTIGVKSMPIRYLFADEIDEYPGDIDDQGDPVALAEKRMTGPTYARRKIFLASTPTVKGVSRIEREYLATDQRRYFLPCPHCGHMDFLTWKGRDWLGSSSGAHHRIEWDEGAPETAHMVCSGCGAKVEEHHKPTMFAAGEWRPTAECSDPETIGFHLSALYSPLGWFPWSAAAREFLATENAPILLKSWVNNVLGETWEDRSESVDAESLLARLERYAAEVPHGVGILVASVDVQGDRLECAVKGYGASEESWLIAFQAFYGDPVTDEKVWLDLDEFLLRKFTHESGQLVPISAVAVDSGGPHKKGKGHASEQVYRFCKARLDRRVFAVRGGAERGKPVVSRPTDNNRYRAKLFTLCVDTAKDIIYSRLKVGSPGPGYCHLPDWVDEEYIAQLTAEKAIRKWVKNKGSVRQWVPTRERNEALDLEVYCLAALYILGPGLVRSLPERVAALSIKPPDTTPDAEVAAQAAPRPRARGWVTGWRG